MFGLFKQMRGQSHRRQYPRRSQDVCVCEVNGQTYPVVNWSLGGVLLQVGERLFAVDQDLYFTLKFKVGMHILDITHKARVVRKTPGHIALKFHTLPTFRRKLLQSVIQIDQGGEVSPV